MTRYFAHIGNAVEGPLDIPGIIRKIRSGKVTTETLVHDDTGESNAKPAKEYPEIAELLAEQEQLIPPEEALKQTAGSRMRRALRSGWRFAGQNPLIFVLSSASVMLSYGVGFLLAASFPSELGIAAAITMYFALQSVIMIIVQRFYRGLYLDVAFIRNIMAPLLIPLLANGIITAFLLIFGLTLLILPGIIIFSLIAFAPFIMADQKVGAFPALRISAKIAYSDGLEGFGAIMGVIALKVLSLAVIITLPLTLPVLTIALAELYDEMGN